MDQARITRPPRLRSLAEMRNKTSIFERTTSSLRSDDEYHDLSTERRAKVKVAVRRETDQESVLTANSNLSSRARATKRPNRAPETPSRPNDGESIISKWSRPSVVKPLFEFDSASLLSNETTKSMIHDDTPWRAAKRGDLNALKQFQATGKVDWMAKDEFDYIPLYYACHTGALVDIMVVPFLLWVTSLQDQQILEKCKKNAVNRQVRSIIKAYIKGGISAVVTNDGIGSSVDSRQSAQETKSVRTSKLINKESTVVRQNGDMRGKDATNNDNTITRNTTEELYSIKEGTTADTEPVDSRKRDPETQSSVTGRATKTERQDPPPSDVVVNITENHEDGLSIIETASQISATRQQSFEIVQSTPKKRPPSGHYKKSQGSVVDHVSQRSSHSDVDSTAQSHGRTGSLKSMLFGDRDTVDANRRKEPEDASESSNGHESAESRSSASEDQYRKHRSTNSKREERRGSLSRQDDDNSLFVGSTKSRKPPTSTKSGFVRKRKDLPPRPPPQQSPNDFASWDSRDEREIDTDDYDGKEDREVWDAPIEQHRYYGHKDVKESVSPAMSRDDDSWSIASLLSLKKWRNNKKQLDPEKIDKILSTRNEKEIHTTSERSDSPSMRPKLKSQSALQSSKTKAKALSRGNFPKPYIEYHENEKTWVIGNQWKQNGNAENDKMIHVCDNRQRVHVKNCHGVNIHIHGRKMKAILVENSSDVNIIFDTVITTCEVVGCSNVGLQVTGLCPTFSIDTTQGVTVWLTREAMTSSNFVTTKSHDICISVPQGDDMHPWERKEVPLPVQYVHKFQEGGILTHVPGRY